MFELFWWFYTNLCQELQTCWQSITWVWMATILSIRGSASLEHAWFGAAKMWFLRSTLLELLSRGANLVEYVTYNPWASCTKWEYMFIIHTFRLNLEIWVRLYSWHYAQVYCSSQEYCQETLFIPLLFPSITYNKSTIIKNIDTTLNIFPIQTGTIHYLYRHQNLLIF
jgi:hypothetical protein